jgi:periplasmic copper chaperone A
VGPGGEDDVRNLIIAAGMAIMAAGAAFAHHAGDTYDVGDLVVSHAWTYETSGAGHSSKVYLTIQNDGDAADRLVEASVDFAGRVVMQAQAIGSDGTLAVQDVAAIAVQPGQVLTLQPGAIWLELEGVQRTFVDGQHFHMTLVFETAGAVEIDVWVNEADDHDDAAS